MDDTRFIGLNVHKERIAIAVVERAGGLALSNTSARSTTTLMRSGSCASGPGRPGKPLAFCTEAGPCGYGVHRQLTSLGHRCEVVAPSLIPMKPGDRVKTDRRDATLLARLHRAGKLTPIWVPDADH
ncbi:hypothetical protein [Lichenifustis flavocetrariae]|uniref:Transposase n=1 Tax=Lichenifustis flavocetrariae TaxID=2949735 RepID=A0AA42CRD0_9HYPH|nr:hypothetical protein [Lichenifustis flavocetrariae]MCW6512362.1 hypothetical protein [Lichenifustis flavocetrariae]